MQGNRTPDRTLPHAEAFRPGSNRNKHTKSPPETRRGIPGDFGKGIRCRNRNPGMKNRGFASNLKRREVECLRTMYPEASLQR